MAVLATLIGRKMPPGRGEVGGRAKPSSAPRAVLSPQRAGIPSWWPKRGGAKRLYLCGLACPPGARRSFGALAVLCPTRSVRVPAGGGGSRPRLEGLPLPGLPSPRYRRFEPSERANAAWASQYTALPTQARWRAPPASSPNRSESADAPGPVPRRFFVAAISGARPRGPPPPEVRHSVGGAVVQRHRARAVEARFSTRPEVPRLHGRLTCALVRIHGRRAVLVG